MCVCKLTWKTIKKRKIAKKCLKHHGRLWVGLQLHPSLVFALHPSTAPNQTLSLFFFPKFPCMFVADAQTNAFIYIRWGQIAIIACRLGIGTWISDFPRTLNYQFMIDQAMSWCPFVSQYEVNKWSRTFLTDQSGTGSCMFLTNSFYQIILFHNLFCNRKT